MPAGINLSDFYYLLPEIVLTVGALLLLLADLMTPRDKQSILAWVTLAVLGATAVALVPVADAHLQVSRGLIAVDRFALFFKVIFLVSAALTVLMSVRYLEVEGTRAGEYYFLILCATLGMMFMAGGTDLITLFIGLETMAISFYILTGFLKPSRRSNEAAVKYFLLGAFLPRHPALRHVADVRPVGHDEPARDRDGARRSGVATRGWSSRSSSSWPAWASRSRRCRSTCGRRTCTKARRRRSPAFCRSDPRPHRSRCCCASSSRACRRCACRCPKARALTPSGPDIGWGDACSTCSRS